MQSVVALSKTSFRLAFRAKPGARSSSIVDVGADEIEVRIGAPPVEGKANEELISFVEELLPKAKRVTMATGRKSRGKAVDVEFAPDAGITVEQIVEILLAAKE
jgi:uncharacterized protein (TIGR00251 family)